MRFIILTFVISNLLCLQVFAQQKDSLLDGVAEVILNKETWVIDKPHIEAHPSVGYLDERMEAKGYVLLKIQETKDTTRHGWETSYSLAFNNPQSKRNRILKVEVNRLGKSITYSYRHIPPQKFEEELKKDGDFPLTNYEQKYPAAGNTQDPEENLPVL